MERILALDVGDRRIGIAVSDPLGLTAHGIETYRRADNDPEADARYILSVAERYRPVLLLFGLPRNMDGSYGFQSEKVREFSEIVLRSWDGRYDFYDERLTTVRAEKILLEGNVRREKRKQVIDKMAACIILEGYLESHRGRMGDG